MSKAEYDELEEEKTKIEEELWELKFQYEEEQRKVHRSPPHPPRHRHTTHATRHRTTQTAAVNSHVRVTTAAIVRVAQVFALTSEKEALEQYVTQLAEVPLTVHTTRSTTRHDQRHDTTRHTTHARTRTCYSDRRRWCVCVCGAESRRCRRRRPTWSR